ncbi:hypothetical protein [Adlercreutzia sp. ZJ242]|uniref:hypothetical protein n=1 Tax=Adlercreutzia sp. ZJ242 TaxID=2709409 RepID=UPI0013EDA90F|nr:hypothetical protein [Adlercreutzia sp. ZJ242]
MTLDEFKKQQRASLAEFKKLVRTDAPKATELARSRLREAKIIDRDNKLTKPYC